jgi:hypothetical protein
MEPTGFEPVRRILAGKCKLYLAKFNFDELN